MLNPGGPNRHGDTALAGLTRSEAARVHIALNV